MTRCEECHQTEREDIDDLDAYIATFSDAERQELTVAEIALDIAILLRRAREQSGLTQM